MPTLELSGLDPRVREAIEARARSEGIAPEELAARTLAEALPVEAGRIRESERVAAEAMRNMRRGAGGCARWLRFFC